MPGKETALGEQQLSKNIIKSNANYTVTPKLKSDIGDSKQINTATKLSEFSNTDQITICSDIQSNSC